MCDTASQPASNLIAEARGVLNRNHGRWPEADWQTLDQFVRLVSELVDCADQLMVEPDPRIIETVEDLDELPFLSVVREVYRPSPSGTNYGSVWERRTSGWQCIAGSVMPPGYEIPRFPARLLYHPERDR